MFLLPLQTFYTDATCNFYNSLCSPESFILIASHKLSSIYFLICLCYSMLWTNCPDLMLHFDWTSVNNPVVNNCVKYTCTSLKQNPFKYASFADSYRQEPIALIISYPRSNKASWEKHRISQHNYSFKHRVIRPIQDQIKIKALRMDNREGQVYPWSCQ